MNDLSLLTVLVVDDDGTNLKILKTILEEIECRLLFAKSGQRAIELAREQKPDLVLLDVVMDGLDGYETCQQIKNLETDSKIVVIFLSGLDDNASRIRGLEEGGVDYITKPFQPAEVLAKVKTHLEFIKMAKALVVKNQELADLNLRQNQLLGMAAHDLRSPLTTIFGAVQLLLLQEEDSSKVKLMQMVSRSSDKMRLLIDELLDISALQGSEVKLHYELVDPGDLCTEHVSFQTYAATSKNITLELVRETAKEGWMDASKFGQVFDNLISNAIKYSHPGSKVHAKITQEADEFIFRIQDQGVGIASEVLERVFEPFVILGRRPTAGERSTGLGLAIVKNIIESHGGSIQAESQLDQGSTFIARWPILSVCPSSDKEPGTNCHA